MQSNYKPLGKYIREVNVRNTDLQVERLLGVSIQKELMPSIANTVGTNMKTYKILKKNQFAYGPVTSRNGDKISIALLQDYEEVIISQAYTSFEIIDTEELHPEYLMMWFRRPEFDRYARFMSHGSARETFDWDELCNTQLPVPSPEKQQEIVEEYNTVKNRISLNNQLIQKLEETAQAIYKQWFVDFEFPNEEGQPYKSSGGKMVYIDELDKEIPEGWEDKELGELSEVKAGGDKPKIYSESKTDNCNIPIFSNSSVDEGLFGYTKKATIHKNSITISARGAIIGFTVLRTKPFVPIVRLIVVTPNNNFLLNYLFYCIRDFKYNDSGSAQGQLTKPEISSFKITSPDSNVLKEFQKITEMTINNLEIKKSENLKLNEFKNVLLSKVATIKTEGYER